MTHRGLSSARWRELRRIAPPRPPPPCPEELVQLEEAPSRNPDVWGGPALLASRLPLPNPRLPTNNRAVTNRNPAPVRPIVIVDIDGTVADVHHRLHHIQGRGRKNWKRFFEAMDDDTPIPSVIEKVRELAADSQIVMLTGRPEHYRDRTQAWLERYDVPFDRLLMRPDGDHRSDFVTKEDLLKKIPRDLVRLAIDDRAPVCEMYRKHGIEVWEISADDSAGATNDAYREKSVLEPHRTSLRGGFETVDLNRLADELETNAVHRKLRPK